ncbi:Ppx/GppA phosphatase family-domain-containing protein [Sporodiniella umbellata]|nr:Ppx/GppA phosphatase family-domain-containing protein [Sporodiniella umbellata]
MSISSVTAPFGIVDMGSNGIRFGIISSLARHLPVAYEERAPIALLDAQDDEQVIPAEVVEQVIISFQRFKSLCRDAGVAKENIKVIATEATRVAKNSKDFLKKIYDTTGLEVTLLTKEQEALISASGIVGSYSHVNGLTMDLGGGSVEVSYVMTDAEKNPDNIKVSEHPVSLPYGAAALKKRLAQCTTNKDMDTLFEEVVDALKDAHEKANLPQMLWSKDGYEVYMSGGGFRALGYLSMAVKAQDTYMPRRSTNRQQMYPIPIINGYSMSGGELKRLAKHYKNKKPHDLMKKLKVFRISKRRASMIPASCFLASAILEVFKIKRVYFSEGGAYAARSDFSLSSDEFNAIHAILIKALPEIYLCPDHPLQLHRLLPAAIHLSNLTSHYPKETRAFVAFHMPLAGGPLANVPGLLHRERAVLAVLLAFRQGGAVPDPIFYAIQAMVGRKGISVCKYIGRLMELVFAVSPLNPGVGLIKSGISFTTRVSDDPGSDSSDNSSSEDEDDSNESEFYPSVQLLINLTESPLVHAPAVMSVIESIDKKVNNKKFDMDEERQPLRCPSLFSVEIFRSSE